MTKKAAATKLLLAIEAAILEIASGAASASISYGNGSKSYTRADLATLYKIRNDTRLELAGYAAGGKRPITMTGVRFV